ncbi:MAG TPA: aminotransferase class IV, partial [Pirellulaceae bacterium]|nr:aminotransferase class IV [Pirellulaceae bacterium]
TPPLTATLSPHPVHTDHRFLYHKTTARHVYDHARSLHPEADDVLLQNQRGELTEFTIGNLVINLDGQWLTPPVQSGLLDGAYRRRLLREGILTERVLTPRNVTEATSIWLINSVRGWLPITLLPPA